MNKPPATKDLDEFLITYCAVGNFDIVIKLIKLGADPCGRDGAALCHAVANGNKKIIDCLLNMGDFRRLEMVPSLRLAAKIAEVGGKYAIAGHLSKYIHHHRKKN